MTLNFLKGVRNEHIELARLCWFLCVVAGLGYSGAHLILNHIFNIVEFGTGMSLLLAGGGGATALKDTAAARAAATMPEPGPKPGPEPRAPRR